ncbi:adenylate kinase domain-containing protein [Ditylenchus destructor]|uniref:Adenylate kinase domain-containing protein n=1 Tax=Ditylenchus destructor TaxID=166010 RepID=A0AAD4NE93_9BILA|nr:adenylate kinase domain-containing protein [Ditylenchus destructor]
MGCAPSLGTNGLRLGRSLKKTEVTKKESNDSSIFDPTLRHLLKVHPPLVVDIGSGAENCEDQCRQSVIFIFGGPGSLKGILTQELALEFEFVTISVEDVIFSYLPHKVANTVSTVQEMQELVRRDPRIITLKWVLQMISAKLSTSTTQRFIIDIVPELISILRSDAFSGKDHDECLQEFDRKHHVLFALELRISEERIILEGRGAGKDSSSKSPAERSAELGEMSAEMSAFIRGVDEADKGRLEKRIEYYHMASELFLNYFRKTKRVVKLDLKIPNNEELMPTVGRLLVDFGFGRNNDSIRVVLFVAGEYQLEDIDLSYYRLRKIRLSDVCHDKDETLSQQIRDIRKFIYRTAQPNENIVVIMKGINNTDYPLTKRINFLECHSTYLDFYIRNREKRSPRARCRMTFRAIASTSGEVCLFPDTIPSKLCKKIGFIFGEKLSISDTNSRAPSQLSGPTPVEEPVKTVNRNHLHVNC